VLLPLILLLLPGVSAPMGRAAVPQKPNIVFLFADDLGWGDLGCYGHPHALTPNLDRLAREGTRFTQFYVTGITCCPSRTGFMTGKFPATFAKYPAGHGFGERVTVTELLKQAGYATGHFGKWHIGNTQKPGTYGIDDIKHDDGEEDGGRKKRRAVSDAGRDAPIYDAAIRFIEKNKDRPFYVNVWGHVSHFPVNPPSAYAARFKDVTVREGDFGPALREKFQQVRELGGDVNQAMRNYLGDVASLDDAVGRLLQRLDDLGLRERTLVVFSSDHGPAPVKTGKDLNAPSSKADRRPRRDYAVNMLGSAGPFRGGKHTQLEGGVRVPFILRWPGRIPAGRVDEQSVLSGIDWLPTLCALTGVNPPRADFDGENTLNAWLGRAPHVRAKPLLWKTSSPKAPLAIRDAQWKLHLPGARRGEPELYDVVADPAESRNLAKTQPDVVKRLTALATAWNATLPGEYDKTGAKED
jgi:N-acetylgalactosamine-6-sulfatase